MDVLVIEPVLDARAEEIIGDLAWEVGFVLSVIPVSQEQLRLLRYSPMFQSVQWKEILL